MIAANSVIDVAVETVGISRSTRQTARIGSYVLERNEDTCQTHHHCHRTYFTVQLYLERGGNSDFHSIAYTSDHASWSEFVDMTHFSCIFPTILWCRQDTRHLHSEV